MWQMIDKIERYSAHISSYEEFISDEKNIDLLIPPLTQIGEIAWKIEKLYPDNLELPYRQIKWFRNILVHMYHNINTEQMRFTITHSIPKLKQLLQDQTPKSSKDSLSQKPLTS